MRAALYARVSTRYKVRKRLISCCSSENAAEHSIGRFFKNTKTTSREGNPNALDFSKCCAMRRQEGLTSCSFGPWTD